MIKAEIVERISQETGIDKAAVKLTIETFMECIENSLANGDNVFLRGFGSFVVKKKSEKNFHAAPGKWIVIPEHYEPFFRPSMDFKEQVRNNV